MKTFDRDEVYNNLIQIYNNESHDEIIERLDIESKNLSNELKIKLIKETLK